MPLARGRREVVQPFDLPSAQLDAVGGGVLLDPGRPFRAGNRSNVVTSREQPGQSDLRRCGSRFGGDRLDFVDDAEISLEVLASEARVGLAPIVVRELLVERLSQMVQVVACITHLSRTPSRCRVGTLHTHHRRDRRGFQRRICTSSSDHYDGLNRAVIRSCTSSGVSSPVTVPNDQTWPNGSTTHPKRSP